MAEYIDKKLLIEALEGFGVFSHEETRAITLVIADDPPKPHEHEWDWWHQELYGRRKMGNTRVVPYENGTSLEHCGKKTDRQVGGGDPARLVPV